VVQVKVLADGFEYGRERYASLSAVAKAVNPLQWLPVGARLRQFGAPGHLDQP
jgi:hypothetical protein